MHHKFFGRTYGAVLEQAISAIIHHGNVVDSRNGKAMDLLWTSMIFSDPRNRYLESETRKHNILALMAETAWVMAGDNKINAIIDYLPRAADFSDDGITWRAGYGPRIRGRVAGFPHDQVAEVIQTLQNSLDSRQAVINIWDHATDGDSSLQTKDRACNNRVVFRFSEGVLNARVDIRSNDLIWGNMINFYEWSVLLELVAEAIGCEVGKLCITQDSLHVYEWHFDRMNEIYGEMKGKIHKANHETISTIPADGLAMFELINGLQTATAPGVVLVEDDVDELIEELIANYTGVQLLTHAGHLITREYVRESSLGDVIVTAYQARSNPQICELLDRSRKFQDAVAPLTQE